MITILILGKHHQMSTRIFFRRMVGHLSICHIHFTTEYRHKHSLLCFVKSCFFFRDKSIIDNFRFLKSDEIDSDIDFASCDVSFISLTKILLPARRLLKDEGSMVSLIKPQFEAGRDKVGKKGVVRDPKVHREVVVKALTTAIVAGFSIEGLDFSPIKGPEGNIEYLMYLKCADRPSDEMDERALEDQVKEYGDKTGALSEAQLQLVEETVGMAHGSLDKAEG